MAYINGDKVLFGAQVHITGVGKKTDDGGEVFNDYESNVAYGKYSKATGFNNIAGSKAFTIFEVNQANKYFLLDSVDGLAVGDVYSAHIRSGTSSTQYPDYGAITNIVDNKVYVNKIPTITGFNTSVYIDENGLDNEQNTFRIVAKPTVGTRSIGYSASAEGKNTKALSKGAHAEGQDTRAYGSYSHTEGSDTEAWYSAHAEGRACKALGDMSHAGGLQCTAKGKYAFAQGHNCWTNGESAIAMGKDCGATAFGSVAIGVGAETYGNHQIVLGKYNKVDTWSTSPNEIFVVGNGSSGSNRGNAFAVNKDGSAVVEAQGEDEKSVVQKQYVDNLIGDINEALEAALNGGV